MRVEPRQASARFAIGRNEVNDVVDVFDILRPVLIKADRTVHLAPLNWEQRRDIDTLCGRGIDRASLRTTFERDGCMACARRAVGTGIAGFRESPRVVVNLLRFIDDRGLQATRG